MFDLIIRNGTVVDGTRGARRRADVGVVGDRIVAVGKLETAVSHHTLDATNQIVAPGFIDVHTHSDAWLLKEANFFSKTSQGFTTELIGLDGISYFPVNSDTIHDWVYYLRALNGLRLEEYTGWQSLGDYMALLHGRTAQNVATFVPYANVRTLAAGFSPTPPNDYQLRDIQRLIGEGMAEGAAGLSNGLDYVAECFASTDEFVRACQPLVAQQGVYVTHVRYKRGTLAGVQEAVEIGKRAGVPVHISHLKGTTGEEAEALLNYIDNVAVHEVDFSFDVYPYVSSSTMLNYMLPYELWHDGPLGVLPKLKSKALRQQWGRNLAHEPLDKIFIGWVPGKENGRYQGHTLAEYVETVGKPPADALCDLLIEEGLAVLLVFSHADRDDLVAPFLAHPAYMMGSDGIYHPNSAIHPRHFGSGARLLGRYVREQKLMSLEEAVYKLAGFPAARFGLTRRGVIAEGYFADLVLFDADTVADRATYENGLETAVGISHVIVNGTPIVADGQPLAAQPGRYLRFKQL